MPAQKMEGGTPEDTTPLLDCVPAWPAEPLHPHGDVGCVNPRIEPSPCLYDEWVLLGADLAMVLAFV